MSATTAAATAGALLLDTRGIAKPREFSGEPGDWHSWVFGFRSYCGLLSVDMEDGMNEVELRTSPPNALNYSEEAQLLARQLYHLLVTVCTRGRAVGVLMSSPRLDGFAAWRNLCLEYEPRLPGRHAAMLSALIQPTWSKELGTWRQ